MSAIELRTVSKSYSGRSVVRDVSLAIEQGERVVLLGPSGSGKTTLLRLIAGLEAPDTGEILIDDRRVAVAGRNLIEPEQRHIGMVFQDLALWPHMTVAQHLDFALRYAQRNDAAARPARVREVLEMVRLADRTQARPTELSGGQQQRVALARALVARPSIVLMDEPLSSLEPELASHLRQEILWLHAQLGFTLLYITHSPEDAVQIGSRVLTLHQGRIT